MRINLFDAQAASQPFRDKLVRDRLDDEARYQRGQDAVDNAFRREAFDYGRQQDSVQNEFTRQRVGMERERLNMIAAQTRAATEAALAKASQAEIERERIEAQTLGAAYRQAVESGDLQAAGRIAYEITGETVDMTPDNADEWNARVLTSIDTILGWQAAAPAPYTPLSGPGKVQADINAGVLPGDTPLRSSGVTVNTGDQIDSRPKVGAPPAGYQRVWDDAAGTWRDTLIPGSAAEMDARGNALDRAGDSAKAAERRRQSEIKLGGTLELLQLNLDALDSRLPVTGAGGDARRTMLGRALTGSSAYDFGNRSNAITDRAALEELQRMRENSPTGGAVGALTEGERIAIGNAVTAINASTSEEEYARAVNAYRKLMLDYAYKDSNWELSEDGRSVIVTPRQNVDGIPDGIDPNDWQFMTPEQRALWQN